MPPSAAASGQPAGSAGTPTPAAVDDEAARLLQRAAAAGEKDGVLAAELAALAQRQVITCGCRKLTPRRMRRGGRRSVPARGGWWRVCTRAAVR